MKDALAQTADAVIPRPSGIITARIIPESGLIAPSGYRGAIFEIFRDGHVPAMQANGSGAPMGADGIEDFDEGDESIF